MNKDKICLVCKAKDLNLENGNNIPLPKEFGQIYEFDLPIMFYIQEKKLIMEVQQTRISLCIGCYNKMFMEGKFIISNKYIVTANTEYEREQLTKYFFKEDEISNR